MKLFKKSTSLVLSLIVVLVLSSVAGANIYAPVSPPPVVIPPTTPPTVEDGAATLPATPVQETQADGTVVEKFEFAAETATTVAAVIAQGATTVNLQLGTASETPGTPAPVTNVTIPSAVLSAAQTVTVALKTPAGTVTLPPALVQALAEAGQPLNLVVSRPTPATVANETPTGSEILGAPLSVVTSIRGTTGLAMPMTPPLALPANATERQAFLAGLGMFSIHSDGDTNTVHNLQFDVDTSVNPPVLKGVSFTVDKFSKFALIKLTRDPLTTTIGTRGYTLAGKTIDMQEVYYKGNDTLMPIRMLKDYGVNYAWDEAAQTATMSFRDRVVVITVGSPDAWVDGRAFPIIGASGAIVPAELAPGRVMVPLRFVSERLGFDVHWDPTHVITITPR